MLFGGCPDIGHVISVVYGTTSVVGYMYLDSSPLCCSLWDYINTCSDIVREYVNIILREYVNISYISITYCDRRYCHLSWHQWMPPVNHRCPRESKLHICKHTSFRFTFANYMSKEHVINIGRYSNQTTNRQQRANIAQRIFINELVWCIYNSI